MAEELGDSEDEQSQSEQEDTPTPMDEKEQLVHDIFSYGMKDYLSTLTKEGLVLEGY